MQRRRLGLARSCPFNARAGSGCRLGLDCDMDSERRLGPVEPFTPLRPVPRRRLIVRVVVAPFLWLAALLIVAITVRRTDAIGIGMLITAGSLVLSALVLVLLRAGRDREQR